MIQRGFTVVELIITITIMGILLILAVVNVNGTQMNARDTERKADVEAISNHMEIFFRTGALTGGSTSIGRYPSTGIITQTNLLLDIDTKALIAPGATSSSLIAATCAGVCAQTVAGVTPQPTISQYVYEPLQSDGTLCTSGGVECRKFNLYYRLETDNTVYMVTSKNQ